MSQLSFQQKLFVALQHCIPQHLLTRLAGKLAKSETPWLKNLLIKRFNAAFKLNMQEAIIELPTDYVSFNAFFTRELKPGLRTIDEKPTSIVSPADGAISQLGKINHDRLFQAKGKEFSLLSLLGGDAAFSQPFIDGSFATIYLSPRDYHRVHMPCNGRLVKTCYIPGKLFSVNDTTSKGVDELFARNERLVCIFDTDIGPIAIVLVGAMIVAGIETTWHDYNDKPYRTIVTDDKPPSIAFKKGDEMGRFKLGSTVIVLFGKDTIEWNEQLMPGNAVKLGEPLASML